MKREKKGKLGMMNVGKRENEIKVMKRKHKKKFLKMKGE